MRKDLLLALALIPLLILAGCGSSPSRVDVVQHVAVSLTASAMTVEAGSTISFVANVTNSLNQSVTWHVNGTPGGSATHGLISNGLYTAPSNVTAPMQVTITAIAQVDSEARASTTVTVTPPLKLTIEPAITTIEAGATQKFTLRMSDGTAPSGSWMSYGADISADGILTAPLATGTFYLQVNSNTTPSKTAYANIRVIASKAMVKGKYTFTYEGTRGTEHVAMAGTFLADGKGGITDGVLDAVSPSGVQRDIGFTGNYRVNADGRGLMSLDLPSGQRRWNIAIAAPSEIPFVELDSASSGAGVMSLPGASAAIAGGIHLFGSLPGSKGPAIAGMLETSPEGFAGESDIRQLGKAARHTTFTGTGDLLGLTRTTILLTDSLGTHEFRVYAVSPAKRFAISLDPALDVLLQIDQQIKAPFAISEPVFAQTLFGGGASDTGAIAFAGWDLSLRDGSVLGGEFNEHRAGRFQTLRVTGGTYAAGPGRSTLRMETAAGTRSFVAYLANTSGTLILDEDGAQVAAMIGVQPIEPFFGLAPTCYDATVFSALDPGQGQNLIIGLLTPDADTPGWNTLDVLKDGTALLDQLVTSKVQQSAVTSRRLLTINGPVTRTYAVQGCRAISMDALVPEIGTLWGVPRLSYPNGFVGLPGLGPIGGW